MKVVKIEHINNFGIFKNFSWDSSLPLKSDKSKTYDFKTINIFYGRNYSGKTSLSRIFRALEKREIPKNYDNPEFNIKFDNETSVSEVTLSEFSYPIHVYNSDFIKDNLQFFYDQDEDIKSFSVALGEDNKKVLEKITEITEKLGSNNEGEETGAHKLYVDKKTKFDELQKNLRDVTDKLDNTLTKKASRDINSIRKMHDKYGDINYDVRKLRADIESVFEPEFECLNEQELNKHESLISQTFLMDEPKLLSYELTLTEYITAVQEILNTVVGGDSKIEELVSNGQLNKWVEEGLKLHAGRDSCAFCANHLTNERRAQLRQHFDKETENLQNRILNGIESLNHLCDSKQLNMSIDKREYYENYHERLLSENEMLNSLLESQKTSIKKLIDVLELKKTKLFTVVEFEPPKDYEVEILNTLSNIKNIRNESIQMGKELRDRQKKSMERLRLNEVLSFANLIDYLGTKEKIQQLKSSTEILKEKVEKQKNIVMRLSDELKEQESKLQSEAVACNRINALLANDLGHQDLKLISKKGNEKNITFEIQRGGTKAHNLSEGEISLISFCYFLVKVQDDLHKNKKPIIWIDDPISSLDANHIFFVFSLIEEKICKPKLYGQLFISTHSLEFLKYLRKITGVPQDREMVQSHAKGYRKSGYYFIQRVDKNSYIKQMPLYMSKYVTEFNYLFEQIYKCAVTEVIDDSNYTIFYNFANNARKFLEIYTFYKFPSPTSSEKERLIKFWGDDIYNTLSNRFNNEYSHISGTFERGERIVEQPEIQKIAQLIIEKLKTDQEQYNALLESIGEQPQNLSAQN